ncbi:heme-degrading domain-containing protein [Nakamurella antarctica]|nr:heme-binding protein [Nakamurella antarctica]
MNLPTFTVEELESEVRELTFSKFDQADAYRLGTIAAEMIAARGYSLAVQIVIGEQVVFKAALGGVSDATDSWLRRKAALARLDGVSSLLVRLRNEAAGTSFDDRGLPKAEFAAHGGAFPIRVDGAVVGTLTASGLEDVVDHQVVAAAIRQFLQV